MYITLYWITKNSNRTIWKPFFKTLEEIKSFSIQSKKSIELVDSNIQEFSELNTHLKTLTDKVTSDYQNLKQFTEDISHEIQTPLAIIQAKIENIIDESSDLTNNNLATLNDIQKNTKRLAKLNKGLILLTKIENEQFNTVETIDLNFIISSFLYDFEDILNIKNLKLKLHEINNCKLLMDKVLADILFSNLIGNAIKYTPEHGDVFIEITSNSFTISNTGVSALIHPDRMFQRFFKEDKKSQSLGLGLAIVKKICDYNNFTVYYTFTNKHHVYHINF